MFAQEAIIFFERSETKYDTSQLFKKSYIDAILYLHKAICSLSSDSLGLRRSIALLNSTKASSAISDDEYNNRFLTRWERLDYTKTSYCSVGDRSPYDLNKLRYYGEYSAHMFGYYVVGWIPPLKGPLQKADV